MGLTEYHRKRDFRKTAEPRGQAPKKRSGSLFVIQKHAASRLHYDFRLELDGVLKSWAVPKGPSLDTRQKRLAMHVEDHPVEYGAFEGIIPQGEYGGGTVMLWDHGSWKPLEEDAQASYRAGKLKFTVEGEKLHGGWMLVRKGGHKTTNETEKTWFLFKERDEYARPEEEGDILEELPLSVTTGRDLEEIAAQQDRVWGSNRGNNAQPGERTLKKSATKKAGKKSSAKKSTAKTGAKKSTAKATRSR